MSIEQESKGGKQGEIRYLTPLDIETTKAKNIADSKRQASSISIIRMRTIC